jgi:tetratricopeptide (TPR) repeat protein
MFAGEVFWISGTVAAQALEIYQERERKQASIPPMPQGLAVLLRECFQEQPEARPDMNAVVEQLKAIYRQEVGKEYGRPLAEIKTPAIPPQKVGEPLHKAGVRWTEPRVWLEWALRAAGRDVAEAEDILQRTGATRRGELVAQLAAYDEAKRLYEEMVADGRAELREDLAQLCLNKALLHDTLGDAPGTVQEYKRAIGLLEQLVEREGRGELANDLAMAYMNKASALYSLGEGRAALGLYDRAIAIRERLVEREGRRELLGSLAKVKGLRAIVLINLGKRAQGVNELREAVKMLQAEVARGRADLQGLLRELSNNLQRFS